MHYKHNTHLLDDFFDSFAISKHIDVKDCGDVYTATLELAGFSKEDVKVFVSDDVLKVEAKKDSKTKKCNLRLKNLVSVASIKSKMENGLLTLTLPKKEVAESVNIEIE